MSHIPRKRFGQHFLVDDGVIDSIVRCIGPLPGQRLVEIGPGLGALTRPLVARCGALTVIELDRDLAARLRHQGALTVLEADVLKVDFMALAQSVMASGKARPTPADGLPPAEPGDGPSKLRLVGNLPYNISTPILFHLLPAASWIQDQHFMLQKEVVERMAATPGHKDYGRLTVMLQWRYRIEQVLGVPPTAFDPPPRVESAVVRMEPLPLDTTVDPARLAALVTSAFSQRRKLLRHTLGRWIESQGLVSSFDLQRRAEEVPVSEYLALARLRPEAA